MHENIKRSILNEESIVRDMVSFLFQINQLHSHTQYEMTGTTIQCEST